MNSMFTFFFKISAELLIREIRIQCLYVQVFVYSGTHGSPHVFSLYVHVNSMISDQFDTLHLSEL